MAQRFDDLNVDDLTRLRLTQREHKPVDFGVLAVRATGDNRFPIIGGLTGKPTMNVVRSAISGMASRSRSRVSRTMPILCGRFIRRRTVGAPCCNGMSR